MIDRIREYCVDDETWKAVREVILKQCGDARDVIQHMPRLCLTVETISGAATVGPWSVTATLTADPGSADVKIDITMKGGTLASSDTWKSQDRGNNWQFLRTNPADPRAVAALIHAFQGLLRGLDAHIAKELARLDDDPDYRSARLLIEAVVVSRSLAGERSRESR